jgi:glutamyl/glutaminyl-tRNA synthetase
VPPSVERAVTRGSLPASAAIRFASRKTATSSFGISSAETFVHVDGDPIILRADGTPAYNFAVVVDDALMR